MSSQPLRPPLPPNPLESLSSLLATHTPHLQSLHELIDLPTDQLQTDLGRIETAVRAEMDAMIAQRTLEVDTWKTKVEDMRKECVSIGRALGVVVDTNGWVQGQHVLPKKYALLEKYKDNELMPVYKSRIAEVETLNAQLDTLAKILPSSFNLTPTFVAPLHPKGRVPFAPAAPSSSIPRYALGLGLPSSSSSCKLAEEAEMPFTNVWEDASEGRIAELQSLVQRGEQERLALLSSLRDLLFHLLDLLPEVDLSIPLPYPLPSPATSSPTTPLSPTPIRAAPPQSDEDRSYYAVVEGLVTWAEGLPEEIDPRDLEDGGLDGVQPTTGLLDWVQSVTDQIRALKSYREGQIQQIYDDLEPLWARLNVDPDHINEFVESHRGSGDETVQAYRTELARMLALKREFMEMFVTGVRKEIVELQDELMLGEDEREAFGAFWDSNYSDELLLAHEHECSRLQDEADSKREILKMVAKWTAIDAEERDLLEASKDPSRLTGRGRPGQMLQEERARKRVEQLKPKLEHELLVLLPQWENTHSRAFMVNGDRVLEIIQAGIDAKEQEKEARKRSRSGPSATAAAPSRSHTPSARSHTPSTSRAPPPSSVIKRKDAPTPLALTSKGTKLPRGATPQTTTRPTPAATARATPGLTACRLPQPQAHGGGAGGYGHARTASIASSTASTRPLGASNNWNVFSTTGAGGGGGGGARTASGMSSSSFSTLTSSSSGASSYGGKVRVKPNPRRESFKPRQSIAPPPPGGGRTMSGVAEGWSSPIQESEVGEVF